MHVPSTDAGRGDERSSAGRRKRNQRKDLRTALPNRLDLNNSSALRYMLLSNVVLLVNDWAVLSNYTCNFGCTLGC